MDECKRMPKMIALVKWSGCRVYELGSTVYVRIPSSPQAVLGTFLCDGMGDTNLFVWQSGLNGWMAAWLSYWMAALEVPLEGVSPISCCSGSFVSPG